MRHIMNDILFSMDFTQDELLNQDDTFSIDCSLNNSELFNQYNDDSHYQDISNLCNHHYDNAHMESENLNHSDVSIQQHDARCTQEFHGNTPHLVSMHSDDNTIHHEHSGTIYHEHYFRKKAEYIPNDGDTNYSNTSLYPQNSPSEETHFCIDNNHDGICDNESCSSDNDCSSSND